MITYIKKFIVMITCKMELSVMITYIKEFTVMIA